MRRYLLVALLWLVGCSQPGALAPAHTVPGEVVLEGLEGSLALRVGSNLAWRVESDSTWLSVIPTAGIGSKVVQLKAEFADELPNQPEYTGSLRISGDVEAEVRVRLLQARVTGRVVDSSPAASSLASRPARPPDAAPSTTQAEILVKYRSDLRSAVLPQGSRVLSHDRVSRITKLQATHPEALLQRLRLDPSVEWAEPNGRVAAQGEPTDQYYPQQWYLRSTGARFAYQQSYTTPVTVAVVDTGVRYDHPDLAGRLWQPGQGAYDFVGDSSSPTDPCGSPDANSPGDPDPTDPCDLLSETGGSHGTHVTGIIVANTGTFTPPCPTCSSSGVVGMAYNAPIKVLPLRVLDAGGSGTFENVALALRYAAGIPVEKGGVLLQNPSPAKVINLSLGSTSYSNAMCEAVAEVVNLGVLVVAAAGNFQTRSPGALVYPAACPGAISVAATDMYNRVAFYSQQNGEVDIAAPGGNTAQSGGGILSTTWNYRTHLPNYTFYMGTSQATPQVAAALAMAFSSGRASTAEEARNLILQSATDLGPPGRDDAYGYGLLNLPGAFAWTLPKGGFLVSLSGPITRQVPVKNEFFETFLVSGRYTLVACRDDSGNGLCDYGEPREERQVQVSGSSPLELETIPIGP